MGMWKGRGEGRGQPSGCSIFSMAVTDLDVQRGVLLVELMAVSTPHCHKRILMGPLFLHSRPSSLILSRRGSRGGCCCGVASNLPLRALGDRPSHQSMKERTDIKTGCHRDEPLRSFMVGLFGHLGCLAWLLAATSRPQGQLSRPSHRSYCSGSSSTKPVMFLLPQYGIFSLLHLNHFI